MQTLLFCDCLYVDVAPRASIASIRRTLGDVFFSQKGDTPIATGACMDRNLALVGEDVAAVV